MEFAIKREDINQLVFEDFIERYWLTETPVILTRVEIENMDLVNPESIVGMFQKEEDKQFGWYDSNTRSEFTHEFLNKILTRNDISKREKPFRVFMQARGHLTLAHYDGNSIHGFNLQVLGRKQWTIISPETPLKYVPFLYVSSEIQILRRGHELFYTRFELEKGEMLFLPRYWQHQVESMDEVNANFNWVVTPTYPSETKLAMREREIVKLRTLVPRINKLFPDKIETYGGGGKSLIDIYTKKVSLARIAFRFITEIGNYIPLINTHKIIRQRADLFSSNNFKLKK